MGHQLTHGWTNGGTTRTNTTQGKRFRSSTLRRDGFVCQACGHHDPTGRTLEADHIINVKAGGTNHPDNAQTLCTPCHQLKTRAEATAGQQNRRRTHRQPEPHPGLR